MLLAAGAGVNAANDAGYTALIWASMYGHPDIVRALIAAGANKHLIAFNGDTAFSRAASNIPAKTAAIRALLDLAP
jgi:ankyrin repeat protein